MTIRALFLIPMLMLGLGGLPVRAETALSGAEFEAYTTGRTLSYAENGTVYGIEEYLPDRRVRWAFLGDECRDGFWYEEDQQICFVYEGDLDLQCWRFSRSGGGLVAQFMGAEDGRELYEARQSAEPLRCPGPEVGV